MNSSDKKLKSSEAETLPLRVAIGRVADLQEALAASAARIENAVSLLVSSQGTGDKTVLDLQELDFTRQSLENLGRLLNTLATHVPDHLQVPTAQVKNSVNLGAIIAAILDGRALGEKKHMASDVDLFDID